MKAGENRTVVPVLDADALTVVDQAGKKVSGGSRFEVSVGFGQPDARTKELTGQETLVFTVLR
ncbi:MAG: hypothetical protein NC517_06480 [Firmicutes bacterium]|nr:hypothetical protein [Bacillota bacterium]